jgi:hypothetical protein
VKTEFTSLHFDLPVFFNLLSPSEHNSFTYCIACVFFLFYYVITHQFNFCFVTMVPHSDNTNSNASNMKTEPKTEFFNDSKPNFEPSEFVKIGTEGTRD